jgi:hypothetical protein
MNTGTVIIEDERAQLAAEVTGRVRDMLAQGMTAIDDRAGIAVTSA